MAFKDEKNTTIFSSSSSKFDKKGSGVATKNSKSFKMHGSIEMPKVSQYANQSNMEQPIQEQSNIHSNSLQMPISPPEKNVGPNLQVNNIKAVIQQNTASEQAITSQADIVEPRQVENTTQTQHKGIGPSSKAVLHSLHVHNATASVDSSSNRDTVFTENNLFMEKQDGFSHIETTEDPFIYFDYREKALVTDGEKGNSVNHDKMALRQMQTNVAGGAEFKSKFSDKGTVKSNIKLNPTNKSDGFIEKTARVFEDFSPEENETEISHLDSYVETAIYFGVEKASVEKAKYSKITKDTEKQIKQLEKGIKAEKQSKADFVESKSVHVDEVNNTETEQNISNEFVDSQAEFKDEFTEQFEQKQIEVFESVPIENNAQINQILSRNELFVSDEHFIDSENKFNDELENGFTQKKVEISENEQLFVMEQIDDKEIKSDAAYGFKEDTQHEFSNETDTFTDMVQQKFHEAKDVIFVDGSESDDSDKVLNDEKVISQEERKNETKKDNDYDSRENKNKTKEEALFESAIADDKTVKPENKRFMTKEERLEQLKANRKATKKGDKKALKKMATRTAVAKFLSAKKNVQNQLGDMSGEGTGDLVRDGSTGLLATMTDTIKQLLSSALMSVGSAVWKGLTALLSTIFVPLLVAVVVVALLLGSIAAVGSAVASNSDAGESYDLDVDGDGFVYESLTNEQIEEIITVLYTNYDDMSLTQENLLRYSLSKVGCAYDQNYHASLTVDIFDCSSLAYRSYSQAGIDISDEDGRYTAAAECYAMVTQNKVIEDSSLKPGDLIFYGGSDNGRYLGVYHVAIYVGKIDGVDKMVEARGKSWGVVYCDVRTANVVKIARPYS